MFLCCFREFLQLRVILALMLIEITRRSVCIVENFR
jgi:hypothetical protein